jgi:hypothetical protein
MYIEKGKLYVYSAIISKYKWHMSKVTTKKEKGF